MLTPLLIIFAALTIGIILGLAIASIGQKAERESWELAVRTRDLWIADLQYTMNKHADLRG